MIVRLTAPQRRKIYRLVARIIVAERRAVQYEDDTDARLAARVHREAIAALKALTSYLDVLAGRPSRAERRGGR